MTLDLMRKFVVLFGRRHRSQWTVIVGLAIVVAVVEASGTLMIATLLGLLVDDGAARLPLVGDIGARFPAWSETRLLVTVGAAVGAFFLARSVIIVLQNYVQYRIVERAGARIATRLLDGYLAMPAEHHLDRNSSELVRNASDSVVRMVTEGFVPMVQLFAKVSMVTGVCVVLLATNAAATLGAALFVGPVSWMVLRIVQPRVKRLGRTAKTTTMRNLQSLHESLAGWRDIRILGQERAFVDIFEADRAALARARYLQRTAAQIPRVSIETSVVVFIGAFIALATSAGQADAALPVLGLFGYASVRLIPEMNIITRNLNSLKFVEPAVDDVYGDILALEEHDRRPRAPAEPLELARDIVVEDVTYRYPGMRKAALCGVSVRIRRGESVGIVGTTGSGKSTLVDLLLGLLRPASGQVLVDGIDIADVLDRWQASIGMVPQAIFLVDDTIRRNVALGVAERDIDDDAVVDALRTAQLHDFVGSLPSGIHTRVGERGSRVSGGQCQRLAIARALYRRPQVLVFDKGTSALDNDTEAALVSALHKAQGDRTIITVAHRLSTVRRCDNVLLLRDGQIVDQGTFDDLERRHVSLQVDLA